MAVIHAALVDETVCGANKRDVGLPSAMLDRHVRGALHIAKRIGTGTGLIDGPTAHDTARMPLAWSHPRARGDWAATGGIAEFSELRGITAQDGIAQCPI